MHDPTTEAFVIRYPWRAYGNKGRNDFERKYRDPFITIWHRDPELRGDDNSCGWFYPYVQKESKWFKELVGDLDFLCRGGLKAILEQVEAEGEPMWWLLWFHRCSFHHRRRPLSLAEVNKHLYSSSFTGNREERMNPASHGDIESLAWVIARIYLSLTRPWYKHPRWHFWHWKLQVHPIQQFKRWAFTRCATCGGRFKWGETGVT